MSGLGFAGSEANQDKGMYTEGLAVFNGAVSPQRSEAEVQATMVHELGHFIGLDHSQIHVDLANDGNKENDVNLPTMYPGGTDDNSVFASLNPDDEVAL